MEPIVISEKRLSEFTSPAEANIHRIANIAKLKLGLLPHFWDYLDWVKSQILENERVAKETGVNQIANYLDVFHYDFDKWLSNTRVIDGYARTIHPTKAISHSREYGYMELDLLRSLGGESFPIPTEIPDFIKQLSQ